MVGVLISLIWWHPLLWMNHQFLGGSSIILLSVFKGIFLWGIISLEQIVLKESVSSASFITFPSLALGSLTLNFFFGESLSFFHLAMIISIGFLGFIFLMVGHAKELHRNGKLALLGILVLNAYCIISDHVVISKTNWYIHLTVTTLFFFLMSFAIGVSKEEWKQTLTRSEAITAGLVFVVSEFYLIATMVTFLPVSYAVLASQLPLPFIMVLSSFLYGEDKWHEQAIFGGLAFALAIPLIL